LDLHKCNKKWGYEKDLWIFIPRRNGFENWVYVLYHSPFFFERAAFSYFMNRLQVVQIRIMKKDELPGGVECGVLYQQKQAKN